MVVPSTPRDVLGLFRSCRDLEDPVLFVEHILLYGTRGEVPDTSEKIPLGLADIKRSGSDISIISYSRMVQVSEAAAELLSQDGIDAEVIDLRSLRPLDIATLVESAKKTHNVLVVEEAPQLGGFAGEIVANVQQEAFDYLDAPVGRIAGEEVPIPYSHPLEQISIPDPQRVAQAARNILER